MKKSLNPKFHCKCHTCSLKRKWTTGEYQTALEHLQRDVLIKKRGGKCEICRSTENLAVDHCFSRMNRHMFFDERNLTVLCNNVCHFKKSKKLHNMDARVLWHVRKREGESAFEEMWDSALTLKPFPNWSKRFWLEEIEEKLKEKQ